MKKILTLIALSAVLSTSAFAAVTGDSAKNLRDALKKAGAQSKVFTDASSLSVSKLSCVQNNTMGLRSGKCSFIDSGRLVESVELIKVQPLISALRQAGVKVTKKSLGENTRESLSVLSINCSQDFAARVSCNIK